MAASVLQAFVARYDAIGGLPVLYFDEDPEQTGYPRAILTHEGEQPEKGSYDTITGLPVISSSIYTITILGVGLVQTETLAKILMKGMQPTSLIYDVDPNLRMIRQSYTVSGTPQRDPSGNKVFAATIIWRAMFGTDY